MPKILGTSLGSDTPRGAGRPGTERGSGGMWGVVRGARVRSGRQCFVDPQFEHSFLQTIVLKCTE
jgi:hypothetical protein